MNDALEWGTTLNRSLFGVALERPKPLHNADAVGDRADGNRNEHGEDEAD